MRLLHPKPKTRRIYEKKHPYLIVITVITNFNLY